jgi:uncharacterized protein (TIGR03067 family)
MKTALGGFPGLAALSLLLPCLLLGLFAGCTDDRSADSALQSLQGTWEGFELNRKASTGRYVKSESASKITMKISDHSLHFFRDADFWFETTFTLPAGTDPPQLHATIQRPEDSRGEGVIALFKLEGGTLTLGGIRDRDSDAEWPKSFEESEDTMAGRYEFRRVRSGK